MLSIRVFQRYGGIPKFEIDHLTQATGQILSYLFKGFDFNWRQNNFP